VAGLSHDFSVMRGRPAIALLTLFLVAPALRADPTGKLRDLLNGNGPAALTLQAPLRQLFEKESEDESVSVPGTLTYKDASTGGDVVFSDLEVTVRGHTSRRETECSFPKLKLKHKGAGRIRIGAHCGEEPDDKLTPKYGRLANEHSPYREALAYRLLAALGVPTLRSRPARITYVDPAAGAPLTRNAMLLEDDDDAIVRLGGTREIAMEAFGDVKARGVAADASRIAFGEALIGNFDWCLKWAADDTYRCDQSKPLWNLLAFERGGGGTGLLMKDFDLAGIVVGGHSWLKNNFNLAFVPSKSGVELEVLLQVQRTRSLFGRAELDALRRDFMARKAAAYNALANAPVDEAGRTIARSYLDSFYAAIGDEKSFYRPVVAKADAHVYADAGGAKEACAAGDLVRAGTPVNVLQRSGGMSQVVLLDARWQWGTKNHCDAVVNGPVWTPSDAITSDYPK